MKSKEEKKVTIVRTVTRRNFGPFYLSLLFLLNILLIGLYVTRIPEEIIRVGLAKITMIYFLFNVIAFFVSFVFFIDNDNTYEEKIEEEVIIK